MNDRKKYRPFLNRSNLTQEYLTQRLEYKEGIFYWKQVRPGRGRKIGLVAGQLEKVYWIIGIAGYVYYRSNLVWLYFNGKLPARPLQIDHINGNPLDDRIENLRCVTPSENSINRLKNKNGHLPGTSFYAKKWYSRIYYKGKRVVLGKFDTAQEAHEVYMKALTDRLIKDGLPPPDDYKGEE